MQFELHDGLATQGHTSQNHPPGNPPILSGVQSVFTHKRHKLGNDEPKEFKVDRWQKPFNFVQKHNKSYRKKPFVKDWTGYCMNNAGEQHYWGLQWTYHQSDIASLYLNNKSVLKSSKWTKENGLSKWICAQRLNPLLLHEQTITQTANKYLNQWIPNHPS